MVMQGLRDSGTLLISAVAAHGDALCGGSTGGSDPPKGNKRKPASSGTSVSNVADSEVFPLSLSGQQQDQQTAVEPSPLQAPALSSVVELATVLADRNRESALNSGELMRHLVARFDGDDKYVGQGIVRYLVAWSARLGMRNPLASACLLECLAWAKLPMR